MDKPNSPFDYNHVIGKPDMHFRAFPYQKANLASRAASRYISYLGSAKVAKQLGVSHVRVSNLVAEGKLKAEKNASGRFVFQQADVDAYLAQRKTRRKNK
jgi:excisionase family DNA binding protein